MGEKRNMFRHGPFGKDLNLPTQLTSGVCPTCNHDTMFVSLSPEIYRCVNCGADCRQYINGSIKYIPAMVCSPATAENKDVKNPKMGG